MKNAARSELVRKLPSVDDLMRGPALLSLAASHGQASVVDAVRAVLASLRRMEYGLLHEDALQLALSGITDAVENQLRLSLGYSPAGDQRHGSHPAYQP